jgi:hypothetical protein
MACINPIAPSQHDCPPFYFALHQMRTLRIRVTGWTAPVELGACSRCSYRF